MHCNYCRYRAHAFIFNISSSKCNLGFSFREYFSKLHTIAPNVRICVLLILKLFEGIYLSTLRCHAINEYFNKKILVTVAVIVEVPCMRSFAKSVLQQ